MLTLIIIFVILCMIFGNEDKKGTSNKDFYNKNGFDKDGYDREGFYRSEYDRFYKLEEETIDIIKVKFPNSSKVYTYEIDDDFYGFAAKIGDKLTFITDKESVADSVELIEEPSEINKNSLNFNLSLMKVVQCDFKKSKWICSNCGCDSAYKDCFGCGNPIDQRGSNALGIASIDYAGHHLENYLLSWYDDLIIINEENKDDLVFSKKRMEEDIKKQKGGHNFHDVNLFPDNYDDYESNNDSWHEGSGDIYGNESFEEWLESNDRD